MDKKFLFVIFKQFIMFKILNFGATSGKNQFSNFIKINTKFVQDFSKEIEKDNIFKKQGYDSKQTLFRRKTILLFITKSA